MRVNQIRLHWNCNVLHFQTSLSASCSGKSLEAECFSQLHTNNEWIKIMTNNQWSALNIDKWSNSWDPWLISLWGRQGHEMHGLLGAFLLHYWELMLKWITFYSLNRLFLDKHVLFAKEKEDILRTGILLKGLFIMFARWRRKKKVGFLTQLCKLLNIIMVLHVLMRNNY